MALPARVEKEHYTYADVLEWDERERWELLDGEAYMMATPNRTHQEVLGALFNKFYNFLEGKSCKVYVAPFGVRLFPKPDNSDDTFFEPDIVIICDSSKLDDRGCNGAPDIVIEILSPSTAKYDLVYKMNKYLEAGVKEYWVVDTEDKMIAIYTHDGTTIRVAPYELNNIIPVSIFPGFQIDLKTIFAGV
jgi:Uma2 family endonuclease